MRREEIAKIDHILEVMEHCDGCIPYLLTEVRKLKGSILATERTGVWAVNDCPVCGSSNMIGMCGNCNSSLIRRELTKDEVVEAAKKFIEYNRLLNDNQWILPSGERLEVKEGE